MIGSVMRRGLVPALLAVALVGSQAGHLVAFQLRFGSAAQHLQSSGAHAYFPTLAKTMAGVLAIAFLAAIFVIGLTRVLLARVLSHRSRARTSVAPSYLELLAALFTIQLAGFIAQEVGESLLAGTSAGSAPDLLLWGTLGQLPVAAVAAVALRWLWTRFESAIDELREVITVATARVAPVPAGSTQWPAPDHAHLLSQVVGGSLGKRGPPPSLRLSS
jgi:hypothetical protein